MACFCLLGIVMSLIVCNFSLYGCFYRFLSACVSVCVHVSVYECIYLTIYPYIPWVNRAFRLPVYISPGIPYVCVSVPPLSDFLPSPSLPDTSFGIVYLCQNLPLDPTLLEVSITWVKTSSWPFSSLSLTRTLLEISIICVKTSSTFFLSHFPITSPGIIYLCQNLPFDPFSSPSHPIISTLVRPSELEAARPQTVGEEELQLQLALAMSKEEAEQEEQKKRSDDVRLQMAITQSEEDFK